MIVFQKSTGRSGTTRAGLALVAGIAAFAGSATQTQTAVANGDTRTLSLYHSHTKESITVTFRRDGVYDRSALEKLNWFLRDWRRDEKTTMDPRLFDTIWETYREVGSSETIRVVSAYRSPETNSMLRRRSGGVAKHSQHTMGKAMDLHLPDVSMAKVREIGMRLHRGGVGYYPTAGTPFVHLDVGSVRSWPRMPRPQLERLFPDGKTVHLPADGTPLPGYQLAAAEIEQRGGSAISYADVTGPRRSLWAALFGGEEEETETAGPRRGGRAVAARSTAGRQTPQTASIAPSPSTDSGSVFAVANVTAEPAASAPVIVRTSPRLRQGDERPVEPARTTAVAVLATPAQPDLKKQVEEEPAAPKAATAPAPPRRPTDLTFAALAAAAVPLPPVRPTGEASAQIAVLAAADPQAEKSIDFRPASVPLPIPRPVEPARTTASQQIATLVSDDIATPAERPLQVARVPLPLPRPTAFAATQDAVTGTVDRAALPAAITAGASTAAPGLAFIPVKVPVPAPRPAHASTAVAAPAVPMVQAETAPGKYALNLDQSALESLLAGISAPQDRPSRTDKVQLPGVRQTYGSAIVAGKFGAPPAEAGRFTGSMVRPLNAGFVKRGE